MSHRVITQCRISRYRILLVLDDCSFHAGISFRIAGRFAVDPLPAQQVATEDHPTIPVGLSETGN